jgi:hypothetical protein
MQEISVVRRRSRLWPIVLAVVVLALVALALWWFSGARGVEEFGVLDGISQPSAALGSLAFAGSPHAVRSVQY